jgi:hypothetical protein
LVAQDPDVVPNCWRSGGGKPEAKPNGCVVVRLPSAEWRHDEPFGNGLFPSVSGPGGPTITQISPREWDVTEPFDWQNIPILRPLQAPASLGGVPLQPGFGFLLAGALGTDDLEGHDSTSCISWVTNVHLTITYTVPPDNGGFIPPRWPGWVLRL